VICQVANFVALSLISMASYSFLPYPPLGYLKFIDKTLVSTENVETLSKAWQDFQKETEEWGLWGLKIFKAKWRNF